MSDVAIQPSDAIDAAPPCERSRGGLVGDLLELSKARLCALVVMTTAVGFVLASRDGVDWLLLAWTIAGTTLSAFGANAINQCIEAPRDAQMHRTRRRPLPAGRLNPALAWTYAIAAAVAGPLLLLATVNGLTASLSAGCILLYVLIYTPLKVVSTTNTLVGAICGAIPPMMGWTAERGMIEPGALVLAGILFVWQIPHFLALAWMYREDYARGGFRMLPVIDESGAATCQQIVLYSLMLVPVTLALTLCGATGVAYAAAALLLGVAFIALGWKLFRERTLPRARRVFLASVLYLPLLLAMMVCDRWTPAEPRVIVVASSAIEK